MAIKVSILDALFLRHTVPDYNGPILFRTNPQLEIKFSVSAVIPIATEYIVIYITSVIFINPL